MRFITLSFCAPLEILSHVIPWGRVINANEDSLFPDIFKLCVPFKITLHTVLYGLQYIQYPSSLHTFLNH